MIYKVIWSNKIVARIDLLQNERPFVILKSKDKWIDVINCLPFGYRARTSNNSRIYET